MRMVDPRSGIEVLDEDACLARPAGARIGRLAVADQRSVMLGSPCTFLPVPWVHVPLRGAPLL